MLKMSAIKLSFVTLLEIMAHLNMLQERLTCKLILAQPSAMGDSANEEHNPKTN